MAATIVLPLWRSLAPEQIREKKPGDLVTEADLQSERLLTRRLPDLLPGSLVVGEEAVSADADVLDRIDGEAPVWIIDPVDGTSNFAKGATSFAIIVALVQGGQTTKGWIYEPANDRMAVAERGAGVEIDGQQPVGLTAAGQGGDGRLTGYSAGRWRRSIEGSPDRFQNVAHTSSAGHEYLELLSGNADFTAYSRLKPWDHAAGVLMVQEAGGISQLLDERTYSPRIREGNLLSTIRAETWDELRVMFLGAVACA